MATTANSMEQWTSIAITEREIGRNKKKEYGTGRQRLHNEAQEKYATTRRTIHDSGVSNEVW